MSQVKSAQNTATEVLPPVELVRRAESLSVCTSPTCVRKFFSHAIGLEVFRLALSEDFYQALVISLTTSRAVRNSAVLVAELSDGLFVLELRDVDIHLVWLSCNNSGSSLSRIFSKFQKK
jgi:hypothetical protein